MVGTWGKLAPAQANSAARKSASNRALWATSTAPRRSPATSPITSAKAGAPATSAEAIPWRWAGPVSWPGSMRVANSSSIAPPRLTRTIATSTIRSFRRGERPVVSRSTTAKGASARSSAEAASKFTAALGRPEDAPCRSRWCRVAFSGPVSVDRAARPPKFATSWTVSPSSTVPRALLLGVAALPPTPGKSRDVRRRLRSPERVDDHSQSSRCVDLEALVDWKLRWERWWRRFKFGVRDAQEQASLGSVRLRCGVHEQPVSAEASPEKESIKQGCCRPQSILPLPPHLGEDSIRNETRPFARIEVIRYGRGVAAPGPGHYPTGVAECFGPHRQLVQTVLLGRWAYDVLRRRRMGRTPACLPSNLESPDIEQQVWPQASERDRLPLCDR